MSARSSLIRRALVPSPAVSKKLEEKQRRRIAEERRRDEQRKAQRRRNLVTAGIALVVAAGVVAAVVFQRQAEEAAAKLPSRSEAEAGCGPVEEHEEQGRDHIAVGSSHEPYAGPAPHSGPHYAQPDGPVRAGFYEEPIPPEGPVHNLEHGQIVFWYSPDAPEDVISDIEQAVAQEEFATVGVPNPNLNTDKNFVMAAWTVTQACDEVSQSVVDEFRRNYQGKMGPEPLTDPFSG